jgi:hypothetical protein
MLQSASFGASVPSGHVTGTPTMTHSPLCVNITTLLGGHPVFNGVSHSLTTSLTVPSGHVTVRPPGLGGITSLLISTEGRTLSVSLPGSGVGQRFNNVQQRFAS